MIRLPFAVWFVSSGLLASAVYAQGDSGTVVLMRMRHKFPSQSWPEAEAQTLAEMQFSGLRVVEVDAPRGDMAEHPELLERSASRRGAFAAVLIDRREEGRVCLWVADQVTHKTLLRCMNLGQKGQPDAATVALGIVEMLHASLLELDAPHAQGSDVPAPVRHWLEGREGYRVRWSAFTHLGVSGGPGDAGPLGGLSIGAYMQPHPQVVLQAEIGGAFSLSTVRAAQGESRMQWATGRLFALFASGAEAAFDFQLGVGGGVIAARASGDAAEGFVSETDFSAVGYLGTRARFLWRLTDRLGLDGTLTAGLALPELSVRFAGHEVARVGLPLLEGAVGLYWTIAR